MKTKGGLNGGGDGGGDGGGNGSGSSLMRGFLNEDSKITRFGTISQCVKGGLVINGFDFELGDRFSNASDDVAILILIKERFEQEIMRLTKNGQRHVQSDVAVQWSPVTRR